MTLDPKSANIPSMSKGTIQYFFKNQPMHPEICEVLTKEEGLIVAKSVSNDVLLNFVKVENDWLLQNHSTPKSVLFGTKLVCE